MLHGLWEDLQWLSQRIGELNKEIILIAQSNSVTQRLQQLRGVGPLVATALAKYRDDRLSRWCTDLARRSHPNVAAVALANKTVRMAWAMMQNESDYDPGFSLP